MQRHRKKQISEMPLRALPTKEVTIRNNLQQNPGW